MLIVESGGLRHTSDGSLVIDRVLTQHSGSYSCVARNNFTSAVATFNITAGGMYYAQLTSIMYTLPFAPLIKRGAWFSNLFLCLSTGLFKKL